MGHYLSEMDPNWRERREATLRRQVEQTIKDGVCKRCGVAVVDERKHVEWHQNL